MEASSLPFPGHQAPSQRLGREAPAARPESARALLPCSDNGLCHSRNRVSKESEVLGNPPARQPEPTRPAGDGERKRRGGSEHEAGWGAARAGRPPYLYQSSPRP